MILIIGGAYQGKYAFAAKNYNTGLIIRDFHLYILDLIKKGIEPVSYMKEHLNEYRDKVILCDDISCGVVPIDATERRWREDLGHVLGLISGESDEVYRIFCGLSVKLKGDVL